MNILILHNDTDISKSQKVDSYGRTSCVKHIEKAIKELGHNTTLLLADEKWLSKVMHKRSAIDLVFNLADEGHCARPEWEPHVPAVFDVLGIPYTGSNQQALTLCLDKNITNLLLLSHNIAVPHSVSIPPGKQVEEPILGNVFPLFVKPRSQDGSIGINNNSIVRNSEELQRQVQYIHDSFHCDALVQEYLDGDEYNVGILGHNQDTTILAISKLGFDLPEVLPAILTYDSKWNEASVEFNNIDVHFPELERELFEKLTRSAIAAYKILGLQDYGRVDFRVVNGTPFVIDVNPNPDLSPDAGLTNMALSKNLNYVKLVEKIIESSLSRYGKNE